jgi:RNA polymerase sigma-70 factor (ECF subfamily)
MQLVAEEDSSMFDVQRERTRALYVEHASDLHAYASRRVGRDLADDVVAETFRRALEHLGSFDPGRGVERGWLFGIATNVLRNHHRSEVRRLRAIARDGSRTQPGLDPLLATASKVDAERELVDVLDAVAALDIADYEILVLVAWEGLSSREVGAIVGVDATTVRTRLHRIRQRLEAARSQSPQNTGENQ